MKKPKSQKKEKKPLLWRILKWFLWAILAIIILFIVLGVAVDKLVRGPLNIETVKGNHSKIVKFIGNEINKCKLGQDKFMNNQICPATPKKVIEGTMFAGLSEKSKNINILVLYNPYNDYDAAIKIFDDNADDKFLGYVGLGISGSNVVIKSCHKKPCKKEENRQQSTVNIE